MTTSVTATNRYKHERPGVRRKKILADTTAHHPAVVQLAMRHAASLQLRVADAITSFAGSMKFVYIHTIIFAVWMGYNLFVPGGFDKYPFGLLTLLVSLEAIFLSTFVMIGQNRQSVFQENKADHDFATEHKELEENTDITKQIYALAQSMHAMQGELKKLLDLQAAGKDKQVKPES